TSRPCCPTTSRGTPPPSASAARASTTRRATRSCSTSPPERRRATLARDPVPGQPGGDRGEERRAEAARTSEVGVQAARQLEQRVRRVDRRPREVVARLQ